MIRLVLGVVLGILFGAFMASAFEGVGHTLFPPPPGVNLTDPAALKTALHLIPHEAKVMILIGLFLGTLCGASAADLIAGRRALAGRIVSGVMGAWTAWTATTLAYPGWMIAGSLAALAAGAVLADLAFGKPKA